MDKIPKVIPMFLWPKNIMELFSNVYQLSAILESKMAATLDVQLPISSLLRPTEIFCLWIPPPPPPFSGSRNHINPARSLVDI